MALETATYISDLVVTNPTGSDPLAFADDHLRLIKSSLKATFPSVTGAISKTHTQINDALEKSGGTMTGTLILSGAPTVDLQASTKAYVDAAMVATKNALYPVGSIYTNASDATNPATLLGFGTWVAFAEGRVLVGQKSADTSFDVLEETGGSKDAIVVAHTHTGTTASSGAHVHSTGLYENGRINDLNTLQDNAAVAAFGTALDTSSAGAHTHTITTDSTGSSGSNANLQPYVVVKMWKRTA